MEKLKISVIIPTRNRVLYLKRLLENINNQTRIPDEVNNYHVTNFERSWRDNLCMYSG